MPSQYREVPILGKGMELYGETYFTAKGLNPAYGTVLTLHWAIPPALQEKQPVLSAQVSCMMQTDRLSGLRYSLEILQGILCGA